MQKLVILAFLFALFAPHLHAQEAVIEEIIVTATKRGAQSAQSIPAAISATSGDALDARGIVNFEDFAGSVPGFNFQDLGPGDKEYIIRGVNGNGPAVVGAYFDDFVMTATDAQDGGGKNAPIKFFDMDRIEVLNGPQGTLYGANSMAGNIRFFPRKPDAAEFTGFIDANYSATDEGDDNYEISGAINIPLIKDVLALRLVGWTTDNSGWIDQPRLEQTVGGVTAFNGNAKDTNTEETDGGRIMLRWQPGESTTVDLLYLKQNMDIGGASRYTSKGVPAWPDQPANIAALGVGLAPLAGLPALTPSDDFVNTDITVSTREDDVELFGVTLQQDLEFGSIVVSAGKYEHEIDYKFDSTPILLFFGVPIPGVTNEPQETEITMLEGRFVSELDGPFNFVAGVYYQKEESNFEVHVTTTDGNGDIQPWNELDSNDALVAGGTAFFGRFRNDEIEQKAVFGEGTYDFNEQWQLLLGLRYFDSDLESVQANTHNFAGGVNTPAGTIIGTTINGSGIGKITSKEDQLTPKLTLSYQADNNILAYFTYSEGFRNGGVNNANQPFAPGIPPIYASDQLTNYEVGLKTRFNDGRWQVNASLFYIDWEDIQVEPRDPAGNIPFVTNGGDAKISGLEWSAQALLSASWSANFTGTYFFSHELTSDQPTLPGASPFVITGLDGDDIPNVPDVQFYLSLDWDTEIGGRPFTLSGDVTYRGNTNTEFRTSSPFNIDLNSYALFNLHANLLVNDQINVGLFAKNLTNKVAVYDGIGSFQDPQAVVSSRPRTIGIKVSWRP
jgi:outer membrane receptor protein involved in Fe transport